MAIGRKKVFRQNILGVNAFDVSPADGTVEICVLGNTQASPKDKAAFLQELKSCFRDAYSWTAAQLGLVAQSNAKELNSDTQDNDNDAAFASAVTAAFRNAFVAKERPT